MTRAIQLYKEAHDEPSPRTWSVESKADEGEESYEAEGQMGTEDELKGQERAELPRHSIDSQVREQPPERPKMEREDREGKEGEGEEEHKRGEEEEEARWWKEMQEREEKWRREKEDREDGLRREREEWSRQQAMKDRELNQRLLETQQQTNSLLRALLEKLGAADNNN